MSEFEIQLYVYVSTPSASTSTSTSTSSRLLTEKTTLEMEIKTGGLREHIIALDEEDRAE